MNQIRSMGIKATEDTLGILEQYQRAIGDPGKTLRQIETLVQSLSQGVGKFEDGGGEGSLIGPVTEDHDRLRDRLDGGDREVQPRGIRLAE